MNDLTLRPSNTRQRCSGIKSKGQRCKIHTSFYYKCYSIDLPVCSYHNRVNSIYRWSKIENYHHGPDEVVDWLNYFNGCVNTHAMDPTLAMCVTIAVHKEVPLESSYNDKMMSYFQSSMKYVDESSECPVCYSDDEPCVKISCGHRFCEKCIQSWVRRTPKCPMCRKFIY